MLKNSCLFLIFIIITSSCRSLKQNETIYWVNSSKVDCAGVGKMSSLQVQKTDDLNINADWELFYSQIEGFEFEPGFIYKLKVAETPIENPHADASSIKYTLVNMLEKKIDTRLAIQDIWFLESINEVQIDKNNIKNIPQIELNISQMKVFGSNGCNNISGAIQKVSDTELEFSPLRETRKMCPNMEISNQFSKALSITKYYRKENLLLKLFDSEMKELMSIKKID